MVQFLSRLQVGKREDTKTLIADIAATKKKLNRRDAEKTEGWRTEEIL